MESASTSVLRDWMWAIPQITFLDITCVIVSLISEMRCSRYITGGIGKKKKPSENTLRCRLVPKHLLPK